MSAPAIGLCLKRMTGTVADREELTGANYVPIFDLANGDLGVTLPGDKDKYQLSDGELTLDVG